MDVSEDKDEPRVFINPEILDARRRRRSTRKAASRCPASIADVERANRIRVRALDRHGSRSSSRPTACWRSASSTRSTTSRARCSSTTCRRSSASRCGAGSRRRGATGKPVRGERARALDPAAPGVRRHAALRRAVPRRGARVRRRRGRRLHAARSSGRARPPARAEPGQGSARSRPACRCASPRSLQGCRSRRRGCASSQPDLLVVVAYGLILPKAVLAIPRHGCWNVHASLLPRWRGAAPIQRAIAGRRRARPACA